jgi:uncharacterized protein YbjQ (UPF0145 family)
MARIRTEGDFLLVTTPILQGVEIEEYIGPVIARNVRAVNVIRDIFTSFRDFFGGRSASYQEVMDEMMGEVLVEARRKAESMGANAVIGLDLDFDSVGAKSKSLLMAVARGTAVRVGGQAPPPPPPE